MQRHKGAYGYFSGARFASTDNPQEVTDEIALNPAHFASRPTAATLSTLAHEMAHLWQHHFGTPSRTGYHNKEWAAKMREIGLIPTDTGQPGGKDTGQKVTHMIEQGGRFEQACTAYLATGTAFLYHDRAGEGEAATRRKKAASKTKYTCPACEHERMGQARRPPDMRRLQRGDWRPRSRRKGCGSDGGINATLVALG